MLRSTQRNRHHEPLLARTTPCHSHSPLDSRRAVLAVEPSPQLLRFSTFRRNQTQTQFEHPPFYTCSFFEKKCIIRPSFDYFIIFTSSNLNKPELAAVCSAGNQGRIGIDDRKYISFERGLTACLIIQCNIEGTKEGTLGCQKTC